MSGVLGGVLGRYDLAPSVAKRFEIVTLMV